MVPRYYMYKAVCCLNFAFAIYRNSIERNVVLFLIEKFQKSYVEKNPDTLLNMQKIKYLKLNTVKKMCFGLE